MRKKNFLSNRSRKRIKRAKITIKKQRFKLNKKPREKAIFSRKLNLAKIITLLKSIKKILKFNYL